MPEIYYEELNKMLLDLNILLEDTNDKEKIKQAENFISVFTPEKDPIIIE